MVENMHATGNIIGAVPRALLAALLLACTLSGCAVTPEAKVRKGLIDAGISEPVAACMAGRMVDQLSITQLRRLGSLGSLGKTALDRITVDQLLYKVRALKDPEILSVTTRAGIGCTLGL